MIFPLFVRVMGFSPIDTLVMALDKLPKWVLNPRVLVANIPYQMPVELALQYILVKLLCLLDTLDIWIIWLYPSNAFCFLGPDYTVSLPHYGKSVFNMSHIRMICVVRNLSHVFFNVILDAIDYVAPLCRSTLEGHWNWYLKYSVADADRLTALAAKFLFSAQRSCKMMFPFFLQFVSHIFTLCKS